MDRDQRHSYNWGASALARGRQRRAGVGLTWAVGLLLVLPIGVRDARAGAITYWNLFNTEGETTSPAELVTYGSLSDMLLDQNRTGVFIANGFSDAVATVLVGTGSDGATFWNLANHEGDASQAAGFASYGSLADMLADQNRLGIFTPDGFSAGVAAFVVDSGSDGTAYWNLVNREADTVEAAGFAAYGTLTDMLLDTNRTGIFTPDGFSLAAAAALVGTGSDGSTYWNLFNPEGESVTLAYFATYATLMDMLLDANRTGVFTPNGSGAAHRLIGTGAGFSADPPPTPVPLPPTLVLVGSGLLVLRALRSKVRS